MPTKQSELAKAKYAGKLSSAFGEEAIDIVIDVENYTTLKDDLECFIEQLETEANLENLKRIVELFVEKESHRFEVYKTIKFSLTKDNYSSYGYVVVDGEYYV